MPPIDELLDDIISADPSLASEREVLKPLLAKMLSARDAITVDDQFLFKLKQKLLHMPEQKQSRVPQVLGYLFSAAAGGALVFMLGVPFVYDSIKQGNPLSDFGVKRLVGNISIESLTPGAFGSLIDGGATTGAEMVSDAPALGSSMATMSARPQSGGGSMMSMVGADGDEKMVSNYATSETAVDMMIAPYPGEWTPTYYRYVYDGSFELTAESGDVYRRGSLASSASSLTNLDFGPVDLGAFAGLEVTYFGASQSDAGDGYNVSVDFPSASISISPNYNYWDRMYSEQRPLTSVPSESDIVSIAQNFLEEHDIDLSSYGQPIVNEQAYIALAEAVRIADPYAGSWMNVTYPLVIDGVEVRNGDGSGYGIDVSVNLTLGEVSGVSINVPTDLASSSYDLTTDESVVAELVERGGLYGYLPSEGELAGGKIVDITVGEPTEVLLPHWTYTNNTSQMLLVPALSFPILEVPEDAYVYGNAVVVPLAQEIIDSYEAPQYDTMPVEPAVLYKEISEARGE